MKKQHKLLEDFISEHRDKIDYSKQLQLQIEKLQDEIARVKEQNYKEKIKLECEKTHNWMEFNEKNKALNQKKKDLNKKIENQQVNLNKKVQLYKKNEENLGFLIGQQKQIYAENQTAFPQIRQMNENLEEKQLKLTAKSLENQNLKKLLLDLKINLVESEESFKQEHLRLQKDKEKLVAQTKKFHQHRD